MKNKKEVEGKGAKTMKDAGIMTINFQLERERDYY